MGCVRRLNDYADVVCEMQCMTDALFKEGQRESVGKRSLIIMTGLQEMFCKQKGYLEEELDYRKQTLDQAYMVKNLSLWMKHCIQNITSTSQKQTFANTSAIILIPDRFVCVTWRSVLWSCHRLRISVWFCRFGVCFCGLSVNLCDKDRFCVYKKNIYILLFGSPLDFLYRGKTILSFLSFT